MSYQPRASKTPEPPGISSSISWPHALPACDHEILSMTSANRAEDPAPPAGHPRCGTAVERGVRPQPNPLRPRPPHQKEPDARQ